MALAAGKLDRRARIEQKIVTRDAYLAEVAGWAEVATVWAGKRDLSGREYFAAAATQSDVECEIIIRWRAGLRTDMRLLLDGAVYDIHAVTEIGRRQGLLLRCGRAGDAEIIVLLAGAASASAALSGRLSVAALLSGAGAGAAVMTGGLPAPVGRLSGIAQGGASLAGILQPVGRALAGTASGVAMLSGQVAVERLLAGTAAGQGAAAGQMVVARLLASMATAAGSLSGGLVLTRLLAGQAAGGAGLSGDIAPPPASDPYWDMVSLSLPMDGPNGGTTLTDDKYPWRSFSRIGGTAALDTAVKQFGSASLSVGTQSYFRCDPGAEVDFGGGDFTVEAWYRRGAGDGNRWIAAKWGPGITVTARGWALYEQDSSLTFAYYNQSNHFVGLNPAHTPVTGEWRHVAVTRENGTFRLYVDGLKLGEMTSADSIRAATGLVSFGGYESSSNAHAGEPCHIDDVRITKGVARYTGDSYVLPFGPSSTDSTAPADPDWDDVALLMPMDGQPAGTDLADVKAPARGFSRVGSAAARSTAQARFGNASLHCLSSSYFSTPDDASLRLEDQDFTIECWLRRGAASGTRVICGKWRSNEAWTPGLSDYGLFHDGTNTIFYYYAAGGVLKQLVAAQLTPLDAWQHLALVRAGSSFSLYFDGVRHATQLTDAAAIRSSATAFTIGGWQANDGVHISLDGFIDDLRVTKGLARYSGASFTPPVRPHPVY